VKTVPLSLVHHLAKVVSRQSGEIVDTGMFGTSLMARRIREYDWAPTPLGPISSWTPRLLSALQTMLSSRFQFVIYWGPELICLYNDAEIPTLGDWHPRALGVPARTLLAEMWDVVGPQLESVLAGGEATWDEDAPRLFNRNGRVEEVFFTYSYSPIRDEFGNVGGVLLTTSETTQRVFMEHHVRILQAVAAEAASAASEETLCATAAEALVTNPGFVFSQVHLFDGGSLQLAAAAGRALPEVEEGSSPLGMPLHELAVGSAPRIVEIRSRAELDLPRFAVAAPVADSGQRVPDGLVLVGVADVRPIDEAQLTFLQLVARQIGSALTARRALAFAAATAEREQIERDLHDGAQQRLMAIQIKLALLQERVDDPELESELDQIGRDASMAVDDLRNLVHSVYPSVLRERGLADALRAFARNAVIGIEVVDTGIGRYPAELEAAVYFCALEAIQNAVKHAGGGARVSVTLDRRDGELNFVVADDGPGFDPEQRSEGMGLMNMHDRLVQAGGRLTIRSSAGHGTAVEGNVPV
jgi:signal transduction histidine kinase